MPFGLRNAAHTLQRFIDQVLRGLPFCYAYIDDLLVAIASPEEHKDHLRLVMQRLRDHGIVINPQNTGSVLQNWTFWGTGSVQTESSPCRRESEPFRSFPPQSQSANSVSSWVL